MFTRFLLTKILYYFNVVVGGNCDITDVRVIHPLVSKDNIQRKHAETNKVHVPSNNRAPNFQVFLRPLAIFFACVFHNLYMFCISARGGGYPHQQGGIHFLKFVSVPPKQKQMNAVHHEGHGSPKTVSSSSGRTTDALGWTCRWRGMCRRQG